MADLFSGIPRLFRTPAESLGAAANRVNAGQSFAQGVAAAQRKRGLDLEKERLDFEKEKFAEDTAYRQNQLNLNVLNSDAVRTANILSAETSQLQAKLARDKFDVVVNEEKRKKDAIERESYIYKEFVAQLAAAKNVDEIPPVPGELHELFDQANIQQQQRRLALGVQASRYDKNVVRPQLAARLYSEMVRNLDYPPDEVELEQIKMSVEAMMNNIFPPEEGDGQGQQQGTTRITYDKYGNIVSGSPTNTATGTNAVAPAPSPAAQVQPRLAPTNTINAPADSLLFGGQMRYTPPASTNAPAAQINASPDSLLFGGQMPQRKPVPINANFDQLLFDGQLKGP